MLVSGLQNRVRRFERFRMKIGEKLRLEEVMELPKVYQLLSYFELTAKLFEESRTPES